MKLASLKTGNRDGRLIVVRAELDRYMLPQCVTTLQQALEDWHHASRALQQELNHAGDEQFHPLRSHELHSPLPRAYQWLDGSAYLSHVERVRKARGAQMPPEFLTDPLMYQGGSDYFLGPVDDIAVAEAAWGVDFESEVAVVVDDTPMGVTPQHAGNHIALLMLVNDVSLRNLIPAELAKGFGFIHGKPPTAFSPVAVTPDELGSAWRDHKVHLPLLTYLNGEKFGDPDAGMDMQFSFAQLVSHAARTRPLRAGTIIGSGTVSNQDLSRGCSCLAEKRVLEIIDGGSPLTPFMNFGDRVRIEMRDQHNRNIFGTIEQTLVVYQGPDRDKSPHRAHGMPA